MLNGAAPRPGSRGPLGAALEPFPQVSEVPGHLLLRLPADDERDEQLAEPVPLEVELDRHARSRTVVERLDGAVHDPPDRAVDTANGPAPRRTDVRHLHGHRLL